jgi:hypothetical protein
LPLTLPGVDHPVMIRTDSPFIAMSDDERRFVVPDDMFRYVPSHLFLIAINFSSMEESQHNLIHFSLQKLPWKYRERSSAS